MSNDNGPEEAGQRKVDGNGMTLEQLLAIPVPARLAWFGQLLHPEGPWLSATARDVGIHGETFRRWMIGDVDLPANHQVFHIMMTVARMRRNHLDDAMELMQRYLEKVMR